jgi:hypothetical protein
MSDIIDAAAGNPAPAAAEIVVDGPLDLGDGGDAAAAHDQSANDDAAAIDAEGGAAAEPAKPVNTRDFILQGLAEIEQGKSAGKDGAEDDAAAEDTPAKKAAAEANTAETAKADPEATPEKPDAESEEATPEEEGAEAKAAKPAREIPDIIPPEKIDKDFNRTSKEIRDVAKQNAEAATAYKAMLGELGGDYLYPSLKLVAQGFMEESTLPVFQGYLQANGVDSFTDLLEDAMKVAMIESQSGEPAEGDEGAKLFKKSCQDLTNNILKAKFGENATIDHIAKLLKYDANGDLNTKELDEYYSSESDGGEAPVPGSALDKALKRIEELEGKQEDPDDAAGKENPEREAQRHSASFDKNVSEDRDKILNERLFAKSALRPLQNDPAELKAAKEMARKLISDYAANHHMKQPAYRKLKEGDAKGNALTDSFKLKYSGLMDSTLLAAREAASPLEAAFSMLYSLRRNGNLGNGTPKLEAPDDSDDNREPTQTKTKAKGAPRTREEHRGFLREELSKIQS